MEEQGGVQGLATRFVVAGAAHRVGEPGHRGETDLCGVSGVAGMPERGVGTQRNDGHLGGCGSVDVVGVPPAAQGAASCRSRAGKGCRCRWCAALADHVVTLRVGVHASGRRPVADANGPNARHSRQVTYNRGCRCSGCRWSATKLGEALARLDVNTAAHWDSWATRDKRFMLARLPADDAARGLIEAPLRVGAVLMRRSVGEGVGRARTG